MKKYFTLPNIALFSLNALMGYMITLKVAGQTELSWWTVLLPLWIAPAAIVGAFSVALLFMLQAESLKGFFKLFKND